VPKNGQIVCTVSFSALTLLAGWQEWYPAHKEPEPSVINGSLLEQVEKERNRCHGYSSFFRLGDDARMLEDVAAMLFPWMFFILLTEWQCSDAGGRCSRVASMNVLHFVYRQCSIICCVWHYILPPNCHVTVWPLKVTKTKKEDVWKRCWTEVLLRLGSRQHVAW